MTGRARATGSRRPGRPGRRALPPAQAAVRVLRGAVLAGVALVLLTPFAVMPEVFYPYAVGKAVWSRAAIGVTFALWALLALADPAARPPRSPLLFILGIGTAVTVLAAASGADFQRSLWSSYERMQGVVDLLHWFAFFLVLVSVLRTERAWRRVLALHLAAGTALVLVVIARSLEIEVPFYGGHPEREPRRLGGPLGNPVVLGAWLSVNAVLALGFAAAAALRGDGRPAGAAVIPWAAFAWGLAVVLHLWGLLLAGSAAAFAGFLAGAVCALAGLAMLAPRREGPRRGWRGRRAVRLGAAALACAAAAGFALGLADRGGPLAEWVHHPAVQLLDKFDPDHPTVQGRLAAWRASLAGFTERPVLGWGPENFDMVFGRYATGYGAVMQAHDRPHSTFLETAVTAGAAGLAAWLALWAATARAAWRAARGLRGPTGMLALFAGAALAAHLVQGLASFDTAASRLQHMLLLAFLAFAALPRDRPAAATLPGARLLRRPAARGALLAAALAAAGTGLATTAAIHGTARDLQTGISERSFLANFRRVVEGFGPLAGEPRRLLFLNSAPHWEELHRTRPREAADFAAMVADEAAAAISAEPLNWRVHRALARLYDRVAAFDPSFAPQAGAYLAGAKALAPNRPILERAPALPTALEVRHLPDGRPELRWRGAGEAGYHLVREADGNGGWRALLYSYDAGRTAFAPPPAAGPGSRRFAVKACLYPGRCSAWAEWPPVPAPDGPAEGKGQ